MSASANRLTSRFTFLDCYRWCLLPVVAFLRWRLPGLAGSFCGGRDIEAAWPLWGVYAVRVWSGDAGRSSFWPEGRTHAHKLSGIGNACAS